MKTLKIFLLLSATAIMVAGCKSTGMQALTQGNYFTACLQAIEKLRSSPDNKKASDALVQAYPLAVSYVEKEAERLLVSQANRSRYQNMFDLYQQMNNIAIQISRCPAALRLIPHADYYNSQLETARKMAVEESYRLAEDYLQTGTRESARKAYLQYQKTSTIVLDYKDVNSKLKDAKWAASLKVVLEQLPVEGKYKISADFFQNKVFEYFSTSIKNEFILIFSPKEAKEIRLEPDQIIQLKFLDFVVGQVRENKDTYEAKRDSIKTGTYRDNKGVTHDVYSTVKAKVTTRKIEVSSSGILDAFIVDYPTKTTLSHQRIPGTFVWFDSYATYNGDERALSKKELELCRRTELHTPPPPQDMFVQFTVPIYNELTKFIQKYYKNY